MPDEGANAYPTAYGVFGRGYTIVDRISMAVLRDPFTLANNGSWPVAASADRWCAPRRSVR